MKKLNLSQWASIAEIIGMMAVVVSLVFVGLEIRQNTKKADLDAIEAGVDFMRGINGFSDTLENASLLRRGVTDFNSLSQDEKLVFDGKFSNIVNDFENIKIFHSQGEIDEDFYNTIEMNLAFFMLTPGLITWWDSTRQLYPTTTQQTMKDLKVKYDNTYTAIDFFKFEPRDKN